IVNNNANNVRQGSGGMVRLGYRLLAALCGAVLAAAALSQPDAGYTRSSRYVEVRDGTKLAVNIYRPTRAGRVVETPLPVVFLFTPYRARYRTADGSISELSGRSMGADRLLQAGYVIVEADVRGKGASFGARRGFQDRTEARDGHDLIEWMAAQPFSNG